MVSVAVQYVIETAGEHKGDAWIMPTDVLPERYAVETGHDHVAEYNIEALRFLVDQLQCLFRVGSKDRLITEIAEELEENSPTSACAIAARTIAGIPGVPENQGVSQKDRPITSSSFAPMPDNDVALASSRVPSNASRP